MIKARILVVDDEPQIRRVMRTTLVSRGYMVDDARNGEDALEKLRAERFDLVLLDMNMPGKSGTQVLLDLKTDAHLASTPVIFLSSLLDGYEEARQPLNQQKIRYIAKSVDSTMLLLSVDEAIAENVAPA